MEFWVTQLFNGISYGALLFLLAGGLSLIFGMMRIVNMTHGSHYLLGAYLALTLLTRTGSYVVALCGGAAIIAVVGVIEWDRFLQGLRGQELAQVLTTMGLALIFQDLALVTWGGDPYNLRIPAVLSGKYRPGPPSSPPQLSPAPCPHFCRRSPSLRRVGILGVGLLGSAVASRLLARGFEVTGYDPRRAQVAALAASGLRAASRS